jgi:glutamine amidotransferase
MIAVLDYGVGNIGSIMNMLKKIGAQGQIANHPDTLDKADKIILPELDLL